VPTLPTAERATCDNGPVTDPETRAGEPSRRLPVDFYGYRPLAPEDAEGASESWWDANAGDYLEEHGSFLGDADFCWCPEGLREEDAALLGPLEVLRTQEVLEIGAGAAQCSRWLVAQGVRVTASDISAGMLEQSRLLDRRAGLHVPTVHADARSLPLGPRSVDVVFSAYGALPFVPDVAAVHREVARVLRPGGRWVFSVTHPVRWAFPDDPGERGLTATRSYFDRSPYVETDAAGRVTYSEHHRTIGDHVRALRSAGLVLEDVVEPEWPAENTNVWGGWSPLRGALLPGTAIFATTLPRTPVE